MAITIRPATKERPMRAPVDAGAPRLASPRVALGGEIVSNHVQRLVGDIRLEASAVVLPPHLVGAVAVILRPGWLDRRCCLAVQCCLSLHISFLHRLLVTFRRWRLSNRLTPSTRLLPCVGLTATLHDLIPLRAPIFGVVAGEVAETLRRSERMPAVRAAFWCILLAEPSAGLVDACLCRVEWACLVPRHAVDPAVGILSCVPADDEVG
mmetsp:Transcript_128366/g.332829  ORF Transcript_128366/g.332829 Transcript_128366/m.332829 type:complete len:209 (-) Transcript_128366:1127-1753(-)